MHGWAGASAAGLMGRVEKSRDLAWVARVEAGIPHGLYGTTVRILAESSNAARLERGLGVGQSVDVIRQALVSDDHWDS